MRMNGNYGIPKNIAAKIKIGFMLLRDIGVLGVFFFLFTIFKNAFPSSQFIQLILFLLVNAAMAVFLILPANGGKKNMHVLFLALRRMTTRRKTNFKSINRYEIQEEN